MVDATLPVGIEVEEQFTNASQQRHAAQLGMWAWLLTELLLFAALFAVALILHVTHPQSVSAAVHHLKFWIGATNTAILICSSFTMSGAIMASRMGWQRWMVRCLVATAALGAAFLLLKGYEYYRDYEEMMTPFPRPALCPRRRPGLAAVHQPLLHHHRPARAAPDHRRRHRAGHGVAGEQRGVLATALQPDRDPRPLLALHRPDLDHRVPGALRGGGDDPGPPARPGGAARAVAADAGADLRLRGHCSCSWPPSCCWGLFAPSYAGSWLVIGLTACMAITVLLFSMEVREEEPLMRFFAGLGFAWVGILFGMTLLDYLAR